MKPAPMQLRLRYVVSNESKVAPTADQRRRLNVVIASYTGDDGHEYRKAFESYGEPEVPQTGTHASLNALTHQWAFETYADGAAGRPLPTRYFG